MSKREITRTSKITTYSGSSIPPEVAELIEEAKQAAAQAYAPYSKFHVGAAVKLKSGKIIRGNNQENAVYPAGLCAERVACFAAKSQFPGADIEMIAIVAKQAASENYTFATPCGSCRQVMSEYENLQSESIKLYLLNEVGEVFESESIENILPFKFSDKDLKGN